jgi:hypothetical protein
VSFPNEFAYSLSLSLSLYELPCPSCGLLVLPRVRRNSDGCVLPFFFRGSNSFFFKLKVWNFEEKVECNHWSCGGPLDERPRGGNKGEGEQQRKGFCSWGHAQKKGNMLRAAAAGPLVALELLRI